MGSVDFAKRENVILSQTANNALTGAAFRISSATTAIEAAETCHYLKH